MPVTVTKDGMKTLATSIRDLAGTRVMVGIPAENAGRDSGPINNATLGYIHENGAPEVNIPARPFLVPGVKSIEQSATIPMLRQAGTAALDGQPEKVDKILNGLGLTAASAVRATIAARISPPLKASTLADRRRRGRTGDVPLLDTGKLLAANTYVIRKGVK